MGSWRLSSTSKLSNTIRFLVKLHKNLKGGEDMDLASVSTEELRIELERRNSQPDPSPAVPVVAAETALAPSPRRTECAVKLTAPVPP